MHPATARDAVQADNSAHWRRRGDEERLPLLHRGERIVNLGDFVALFGAVAVVVAAAWFAAELFYWLIDGDEGGGDE